MSRCVVPLAAALCVVAALVPSAVALQPVTLYGHRLIQFDVTQFGKPESADPRGTARHQIRGALQQSAGDLPIVVEASELPVLASATALLQKAKGGLVVLLPPAPFSAEVASKLRDLEAAGVAGATSGAVYVVRDHGNVTAFRELLKRGGAVALQSTPVDAAGRRVSTGATAATQVVVLGAEVVQPATRSGSQVLVVAGFDTLGAFPGAPQQLSAAADAAAVVELTHLFGCTQSEAANRKVGISVLLSSGDRHSYHGLKQWLSSTEGAQVTSRADAVVCIESLAAGDEGDALSVHVARNADDSSVKDVVAKFDTKARVVSKRLDPSQQELRWAHEVFAFKGLHAFTVSGADAATPQVLRSTIADSSSVDAESIAKRVDIIARAISKISGVDPTGSASAVRIAKTLSTIHAAGNPRPSYKMPAKVIGDITRLLTDALKCPAPIKTPKRSVRKAEFNFAPPEATFHGPDDALLIAYESVSTWFELTLTAVIVAALAVTAIALLGWRGTLSMFGLAKPVAAPKARDD